MQILWVLLVFLGWLDNIIREYFLDLNLLALPYGGSSLVRYRVSVVRRGKQFDFVVGVSDLAKMTVPYGRELREHL